MAFQAEDNNDGPLRLPQHATLNQRQPLGESLEETLLIPLKNSIISKSNNNLQAQQQQQQQLPPPLRASNAHYYYFYTSAPTPSSSYDNSNADQQGATGVWHYMTAVFVLLVLWVFSLMLPKGARKQFFGSMPRRYNRRRYAPSEVAELSTISGFNDSVDDSILQEVEKRRISSGLLSTMTGPHPASNYSQSQSQQQQQQRQQQMNNSRISVPDTGSDTGSVFLRPKPRSAIKGSRGSTGNSSYLSAMRSYPQGSVPPPSPGHPAIPRPPSAKILNETMKRLKSRGIRLVAHGVASESKRVWIRFEEDITSLSWQTEFPRKVPNQLGEVSLVMMRGAMHRIALPNILYVDVGKKTNALKKPENESVPEQVCFSLLTQNGSLDLQANSRLERDALVSAFSMILDEVHTQDWRSLYAESPDTSAVQSSCTGSDLHAVEF